jgi:hypothetical protein
MLARPRLQPHLSGAAGRGLGSWLGTPFLLLRPLASLLADIDALRQTKAGKYTIQHMPPIAVATTVGE